MLDAASSGGYPMRRHLFAAGLLAIPAAGATQPAAPTAGDTVFGLGQIIVTARPPEGIAIGGEALGQEAIYAFNRNSLDEFFFIFTGFT